MKTILVMFGIFSAMVAFGQAEPSVEINVTSGASRFVLMLIPVLVPMILGLAKAEVPKLPSWILPILAPALGALIDWLTSLATGTTPNPIASAVLGAAGVGLREVYDQVRQRVDKKGGGA